MQLLSVGPRNAAANQTDRQPGYGGDTSVTFAYRISGNGKVHPAPNAGQPPPRPKVMIVRRKWAVGRTYQFPAINTAATVVNASRKSATSS